MSISIQNTAIYKKWLNQFEEIDRAYAQLLVSKLQWVSSHEFSIKIKEEITKFHKYYPNEKFALFVEREVKKNETVYKFQKKRPQRAEGMAFPPISDNAKSSKDYEIGSEGILNNIATSIKRANDNIFFYYPDASTIRDKKISKIIILTDTIASGRQLNKFLNTFLATPTIRSWHSSGYIKFYIVCYAASMDAISYIQNHILKPTINFICICPQIYDSFNSFELKKIQEICLKYNPYPSKKFPFQIGYGDIGSLIYYEHGIPNNAPEIFYKKSPSWEPLFRGRTTIDVSYALPGELKAIKASDYRLIINEKNIGLSDKFNKLTNNGKIYVMILLSLKVAPRSEIAISKRTNLPYSTVVDTLIKLRYLEWIDSRNRITDEGYLLIRYLMKNIKIMSSVALPNLDKKEYYPTSLRRP